MTDADELRALQRRAYGREGTLTRAEAARLRELQQASPSVAGDPVPVLFDALAGTSVPGRESDHRRRIEQQPGVVAVDDAQTAQDADASGATGASTSVTEAARVPELPALRVLLRRHWRLITVASVLLLVIGFGLSWLVFGPSSTAVALTADEQNRRATLEVESDFDPGTLRAVGKDEDSGAIAWLGTKGSGDLTCAVIDVGEATQSQCQRTSDFEEVGINVQVMLAGEAIDDATATFTTVNAYIVLATDGRPMASMQQWDSSSSILAQFAGDERTRAEELVAQGFEMNLSIVGYFHEEPVWMANRYGETVEPETCLIVDAGRGDPVCLPSTAAIEDGLSVFVSDDGSGSGHDSALELAFTASQMPYLTITAAEGD